jgi:hypothetical protein
MGKTRELNMDYGHVCFAYTQGKWYDWCIAKMTGSQWSHSFLTCPPILGEEMVMEADNGGVSICSFDSHYRQDATQTYQIFRLKTDQDLKDFSIKNRIKELEVSYGFLEYPWFMWRTLNKLFGRDIKSQNNWCQNGTEVCSQLLREYIEDCIGTTIFAAYGKGSMAPQDIYNIVLMCPSLFELIEEKDSTGKITYYPAA